MKRKSSIHMDEKKRLRSGAAIRSEVKPVQQTQQKPAAPRTTG
jgi:hypothetical protein